MDKSVRTSQISKKSVTIYVAQRFENVWNSIWLLFSTDQRMPFKYFNSYLAQVEICKDSTYYKLEILFLFDQVCNSKLEIMLIHAESQLSYKYLNYLLNV